MALTPRQKAFADYYMECGNATEAARKAGYSQKNIGENAAKTLKNPNVAAYIARFMQEQSEKRIAKVTEVLEFYTAVMRGEVKDQFGLEASLSDRLKAGDSLMKRYTAGGYTYGETKKEEDPLSKALREEAERMQNENSE